MLLGYYGLIIAMLLSMHLADAQIITPEDMVTYEKQSSFIEEFQVPVQERGLEGITTDLEGNVWFLHSTNRTSTIFKLNPDSGRFVQYVVEGDTVADNAVINLAAGHLVFDSQRNAIWFADARTNSVGRLDVASGKIQLAKVATQNAGVMGIVLAPDGDAVWFTEIMGDKIGSIDPETMKIAEYSTGEDSGPALLIFDDKGILWVTLSFSNNVLRIDTPMLSSSPSAAMTALQLSGRDTLSPFGIAVSEGKVYVSDHGSSRIIVSDEGFVSYVSYWTSHSKEFPTTLPGEVVADREGNIYFPQHGGNRISAIDKATGAMTEYEIPTGPLSTAVFIAASLEGTEIWFTEWASNKIARLNTSAGVPFEIQVKQNNIILTNGRSESIDVSLKASGSNQSVSLSEVGVALIGMTESGLRGVTYAAEPQRVNLQQSNEASARINLQAESGAIPGKYTVMIRATAVESNGLLVSKLYPVSLVLDVPAPSSTVQSTTANAESDYLRDVIRILAISAAAGLVGYLIYKKTKKKATNIR